MKSDEADLLKLEAYLTGKVEEFLAKGGKLVSNSFGSIASGCSCPIVVGLCGLSYTGGFTHVINLLADTNLPSGTIGAFISGYDGTPRREKDPAYQLGLRFRKKYPSSNEK